MKRLKKLVNRWHEFKIGTWNIGNGTIADALRLMRQVHILCFQEASDQKDLKKALRAAGYDLIELDAKAGQAACFIAFDTQHVELIRTFAHELLKKQYIGSGAGPDRNKPKWLIGGVFRHKASGRRVVVSVTHVVPSQHNRLRLNAALDMNEFAEATMDDFEAAVFVCADWNTEPDGKSLAPWRNGGWESVMRKLGWLDTRIHRTIDDILFRRRSWVRLKGRKTQKNRSDHNAVIATFMLKSRR